MDYFINLLKFIEAIPSEIYRTVTAKRCLNPVFNELFTSQDLPKSILKDGLLKLKVYDDERYSNDLCLGEVTIPLKKLENDNMNNNETKIYNLCNSKEVSKHLYNTINSKLIYILCTQSTQ
jgi:Ca2+-dependent lipid-binding protein